MPEWPKFWWESITGPKNLTLSVSNSLHNYKNVCLVVPDDLPWRAEMRNAIAYNLTRYAEMNDFVTVLIDADEEGDSIKDIGRFLLEQYADPRVATGYRGRGSIQQYIADNHVLDNRILWIKGMDLEWSKKWLTFCQEFPVTDYHSGRFVLELHQLVHSVELKNVSVINYADTINSYDLTLFNSIFLSQEEHGYSSLWQQYASILCANLCVTDAEVSMEIMTSTDFLEREPKDALREIARASRYSRRGNEDPNHILNIIRKGRDEEFNTRSRLLIWYIEKVLVCIFISA